MFIQYVTSITIHKWSVCWQGKLCLSGYLEFWRLRVFPVIRRHFQGAWQKINTNTISMLFFVHTQMSLSHLLPLKVNRKLARPCTQNEIQLGFAIECVHMTSRGVNKETAAILEEWNILLRIELYFYANSSFCFIMQIWLLVTWANTLYWFLVSQNKLKF